MKKLISLFLVIAMLSSFAIVVNAETKMTFDFDWFTSDYDDFGDTYAYNKKSPITEANPGDAIAVRISVPANSYLGCVGYYLEYDPGVLEVVAMEESMNEPSLHREGLIKHAATIGTPSNKATIFAIYSFLVKETPVKTLDSLITFTLDPECKQSYNPEGGADAFFTSDEIVTNIDALTINGLAEGGSKEFAVEANLVDGKVVVTAENIGENAGTVYVATYNEGVLVDCEVKALADIADGWTVENLDGEAANAQIYVWNDQNVPLFDNVITVSAE